MPTKVVFDREREAREVGEIAKLARMDAGRVELLAVHRHIRVRVREEGAKSRALE